MTSGWCTHLMPSHPSFLCVPAATVGLSDGGGTKTGKGAGGVKGSAVVWLSVGVAGSPYAPEPGTLLSVLGSPAGSSDAPELGELLLVAGCSCWLSVAWVGVSLVVPPGACSSSGRLGICPSELGCSGTCPSAG